MSLPPGQLFSLWHHSAFLQCAPQNWLGSGEALAWLVQRGWGGKDEGGKSEMKSSLPSIPGKTGAETEGKGSVGNEATLGTRHLRLNYFWRQHLLLLPKKSLDITKPAITLKNHPQLSSLKVDWQPFSWASGAGRPRWSLGGLPWREQCSERKPLFLTIEQLLQYFSHAFPPHLYTHYRWINIKGGGSSLLSPHLHCLHAPIALWSPVAEAYTLDVPIWTGNETLKTLLYEFWLISVL